MSAFKLKVNRSASVLLFPESCGRCCAEVCRAFHSTLGVLLPFLGLFCPAMGVGPCWALLGLAGLCGALLGSWQVTRFQTANEKIDIIFWRLGSRQAGKCAFPIDAAGNLRIKISPLIATGVKKKDQK